MPFFFPPGKEKSCMGRQKNRNTSCEFKMTHQATANRLALFLHMVSVVARIMLSGFLGQTYVRTDTFMCEINDYPFGRGLVGQKIETLSLSWGFFFVPFCNETRKGEKFSFWLMIQKKKLQKLVAWDNCFFSHYKRKIVKDIFRICYIPHLLCYIMQQHLTTKNIYSNNKLLL